MVNLNGDLLDYLLADLMLLCLEFFSRRPPQLYGCHLPCSSFPLPENRCMQEVG